MRGFDDGFLLEFKKILTAIESNENPEFSILKMNIKCAWCEIRSEKTRRPP